MAVTTPSLAIRPRHLLPSLALVLGSLATLPALADTTPPDGQDAVVKGWALAFENDFIGSGSSQDRWFTNGLELLLAFQKGREPALLKPALAAGRWLVPQDCQGDGCGLTLNTVLGQNMYTPSRIDIAAPQPKDRPWAGWLYTGIGLSNLSGNRQQELNLKIGVTGPASLAEEVQKGAHCCLGSSKDPQGWDNQLRPMLGVQLSYLSTHYHFVDGPIGLQSSWGGSLGNVRTQLRGGLAITWSPAGGTQRGSQTGSLDEGEFFTPQFGPVATGGTLWESLRHTVFFAHAQISAVAYNAFIQGRTYAGPSDIDPERLVGTSTLGFQIPLGDRGEHKLGLSWKRRTAEFKVRGVDDQVDRLHGWGVLSYSHDL